MRQEQAQEQGKQVIWEQKQQQGRGFCALWAFENLRGSKLSLAGC